MGQLALLLTFHSYTPTPRYAVTLLDPLLRYHAAQCNPAFESSARPRFVYRGHRHPPRSSASSMMSLSCHPGLSSEMWYMDKLRNCCWSHIISHTQVCGHRTGSSHSRGEEYPRENDGQPEVVRAYITADSVDSSTKNIYIS